MKKLEKDKREKIIYMLASGKSTSVVAKDLKISSRTVRRIRSSERPSIPKGKRGRPAKLSKPIKRFINRLVLSGKVDTATQVANQLSNESNLDVSP